MEEMIEFIGKEMAAVHNVKNPDDITPHRTTAAKMYLNELNVEMNHAHPIITNGHKEATVTHRSRAQRHQDYIHSISKWKIKQTSILQVDAQL